MALAPIYTEPLMHLNFNLWLSSIMQTRLSSREQNALLGNSRLRV